jgi:Na+-translocating ferredoxin:NAD+ oxidoreductase subunit B
MPGSTWDRSSVATRSGGRTMSYSITESCNGCQACKKICPVDAISGERKTLHAIDGTMCIECGACGRICPQQAVQDQSGNKCTMIKRSGWMKPRIQVETCMSCTICIDACPVNCLALSEASNTKNLHGHPYLKDEKACIGCGFCSLECPVEAISMVSP